MEIEQYISSGILELYVYGALSESESREVSTELKKHPAILKEVEEIEHALTQLALATAPYNPEALLYSIQQKVTNKQTGIIDHPAKKKSNLALYISWAACAALLIGLVAVIFQKNELRDNLDTLSVTNAQLEQKVENAEQQIFTVEQQVAEARNDADKTKELLDVFRDKEITTVPLGGQKVAPNAYAEVHWDERTQKVYIDAKDLPMPPEGKEYQVWSLTLKPLSPTSIGMLSDFEGDDNKIFMLNNPNSSQAFGITLEPKGGSKAPTMDQLYTMGKVQSS